MRKLTEEEFITRLQKIHGNKYSYEKGNFVDTKTKVKLFCNHCEKYFYIEPNKLFRGQGCCHCRAERIGIAKTFTFDEFKQKALNILGKDYEILSTDYKGQNSIITIRHKTCNTIYQTRATYIINKHRTCPFCMNKRKKHSGFIYTQQDIESFIKDEGNDEYILLSNYKNAREKMKFKHLKCGSEFLMSFSKFRVGQRCPFCQHSKGEDRIFNLLKKNKDIILKTQYKFDDLRSGRSYRSILRFDFAVFDKNNNLKCLIEYDGEQHFLESHCFAKNASAQLKKQKRLDNLKNEYCRKNNYKLIRISYLEFKNIETILKNNKLI